MSHPLGRLAAGLAGIVLLTGLAACDPRSDPVTPRGAGFQQDADGRLAIWFGQPCRDVVEVRLDLTRRKDDPKPALTYVLRAPGYVPSRELPRAAPTPGSGAPAVEGLTLGAPVPGLRATSPLPDDVDWRDYYSVELLVRTSGGQPATYVVTKRLTDESADHPRELYVQDQGWFDRSAFAAADGGRFKALCSSINPG